MIGSTRSYHALMKPQVYRQLDEMGKILDTSTVKERLDTEPKIAELRRIYDRHWNSFTDVQSAGGCLRGIPSEAPSNGSAAIGPMNSRPFESMAYGNHRFD